VLAEHTHRALSKGNKNNNRRPSPVLQDPKLLQTSAYHHLQKTRQRRSQTNTYNNSNNYIFTLPSVKLVKWWIAHPWNYGCTAEAMHAPPTRWELKLRASVW